MTKRFIECLICGDQSEVSVTGDDTHFACYKCGEETTHKNVKRLRVARKRVPAVMFCELCGNLISTMFPFHECNSPKAHPVNKMARS